MNTFQEEDSIRKLEILNNSFKELRKKSNLKHVIYAQIEFWASLSTIILGLFIGISSRVFSIGENATTILGFSISLITAIMKNFKIATRSEHQKQISVSCEGIIISVESRKNEIESYLRYNRQLQLEGKPMSEETFDIDVIKLQINKFFETLRDLKIGGKTNGHLQKIETQLKSQ